MPGEQTPIWKVGRIVFGAFFHAMFRMRFVDAHNLPSTGGGVVAPNHISSLDPVVIQLLVTGRDRTLHFFSGTEFFARPVIGHGLRAFDQIPLKRGANDTEAMERAIALSRGGRLFGLFPEGKINNEEALLRGRRGGARIAVGSSTPLIPMGIWGTQVRWPGSGLTFQRPLRPTVVVVVGEPMQVDPDATSAREILHITNDLMSRIEDLRDRAKAIAGARGLAR
jgi:1-acyl-sn-glycerol-3-phosphate acyltransferase